MQKAIWKWPRDHGISFKSSKQVYDRKNFKAKTAFWPLIGLKTLTSCKILAYVPLLKKLHSCMIIFYEIFSVWIHNLISMVISSSVTHSRMHNVQCSQKYFSNILYPIFCIWTSNIPKIHRDITDSDTRCYLSVFFCVFSIQPLA